MKEKEKDMKSADSGNKGHHSSESDLQDFGGSENASANRGGTTDLSEEALTVDRGPGTERGSGLTTKRTVTGSDFDGQASTE